MHRTLLLWLMMCIPAQAQDFMTREDMEAYVQSQWENGCENPKNQDRWGVREPTEEEILEHGRGIMVFEYLNNKAGCSDGTEGLGIWYDGVRFLELRVEVLGREYDSQERISFHLDPDLPYAVFDNPMTLLHDSDDFHTWILYPLLY